MNVWFLFGLCAVGALFAFYMVMKPMIDDYRVRSKVLNFDEGMRSYFFALSEDEPALRKALAEKPEAPLDYEGPDGEDRIVFRKDDVEAAYRLRFYEREGKSWLRVSRVAEDREPGNIPYLINAFFIKGFGAKPLDYRAFEELFPEA